MILKIFKADFIKLKKSPVWLAFLIIPILPAFLGTLNYMQNTEILLDKWYSMWSQHTLFMCYFFLPALIGVYCAYLIRIENNNNNWNKVLSMPVNIKYIFISKLMLVSIMVIVTHVWIGALYVLAGKIIGFTAPIPKEMTGWLLRGSIGGIVTASVQLFISVTIKSFAASVGAGLIGGIGGLTAASKGIGIWFPYSLTALGMCASNPRAPMIYTTGEFIISSIVYILLFTLSGSFLLKKIQR